MKIIRHWDPIREFGIPKQYKDDTIYIQSKWLDFYSPIAQLVRASGC